DTHTTPWRAKAWPSYTGTAEEPRVRAPPCSHTSTGRRARGDGSGVHTLRLRQPSPATNGSERYCANASEYGGFGAVGPNAPASRTPSHGSGGTGGRNRRGPNGGAAYGMPRYTATPRSHLPRTAPWGVAVTGCAWSAVICHQPFTAPRSRAPLNPPVTQERSPRTRYSVPAGRPGAVRAPRCTAAGPLRGAGPRRAGVRPGHREGRCRPAARPSPGRLRPVTRWRS